MAVATKRIVLRAELGVTLTKVESAGSGGFTYSVTSRGIPNPHDFSEVLPALAFFSEEVIRVRLRG